VVAIDGRTLRPVARIRVGRRPWGIALSRDGRWLYSANGLGNDVSVVDTRTGRVAGTVKVGNRPWGIAVGR
jgi:YVTN family beta-propeller protein